MSTNALHIRPVVHDKPGHIIMYIYLITCRARRDEAVLAHLKSPCRKCKPTSSAPGEWAGGLP